MEGPIVWEN